MKPTLIAVATGTLVAQTRAAQAAEMPGMSIASACQENRWARDRARMIVFD